ncbi:MAG: glycosyltransferase [Ferruginibacter sp.]
MLQAIFFVVSLLLLCYALLLLYYRSGWYSLPYFNAGGTPNTFITVIIPARNEAAVIGRCLDALRQQSYPSHLFEVLVVDDFSEDETPAFVQAYATTNIKLLSLSNYIQPGDTQSFKKKAIEVAVEQAKGELVVTTDADCIAPPGWLHTIAAFYEAKKPVFIAMPVLIKPASSFISIFQALDFMTLQGITAASVHKKMHSMCNGANLAYTKTAFNTVNGFWGIDNIASGDDMLLMHKIYHQWPHQVMYLKSAAVIVQTAPVNSIAAFFNQRIRWASKADKYDDKRIFSVLLLVYLLNMLLLLWPFAALGKNFQLSIFNFQFSTITSWLLLLCCKTAAELFFLVPVARFFNMRNILWWFPLMQPVHIVYTVISGWLGKFGSYKWKDRKVK